MGLSFSQPSVYSITPPTIKRRVHNKLFESPVVTLERPVEQFFNDFSDSATSSVITGELFQTTLANPDLTFYCKTDILLPNEKLTQEAKRKGATPIEGGLELKGEIGITKDIDRDKVVQLSIEPTASPQIIVDFSHRVENWKFLKYFLYTTGLRFDVGASHTHLPLPYFRFSFDTAKFSSGVELCLPSFGPRAPSILTPTSIPTPISPSQASAVTTVSALSGHIPPSNRSLTKPREVGSLWLAYKLLPTLTCASEFSVLEKENHYDDDPSLRDVDDEIEDETSSGTLAGTLKKEVKKVSREVGRTVHRALQNRAIDHHPESVRISFFKKVALQYAIPNSHQFTLSYSQCPFSSSRTLSLSVFQHNLLRRQIWNPFEDIENRYINNIIDIVFKLSIVSSTVLKERVVQTSPLANSGSYISDLLPREVIYEERKETHSKIQMGLNWQINKNFAFKAKLNQNGLSLLSVFKSWSNPAFSVSLSACNVKPFTSSPEYSPTFGLRFSIESWGREQFQFEEPSDDFLRTVVVKKRTVAEIRDPTQISKKSVTEYVR